MDYCMQPAIYGLVCGFLLGVFTILAGNWLTKDFK